MFKKELLDYFVDIVGWPIYTVFEMRNRKARFFLAPLIMLTYGLPVAYPLLVAVGIPLLIIDVIRDEVDRFRIRKL